MSDKPPIVELKGVSKWFPGPRNGERLVAVEKVDLTIPDTEGGEFVALLGPSGCGGSTVLSLIAGMVSADEGEVLTYGKPLRGPNPDSVTVPQAYTCFPWLSAMGNVQFGLGLRGVGADERTRIAAQYLTKVGLGDRGAARIRELSGGMQQRVAIARTLATQPRMVLMDEPFGALDAQTRADMQRMLLGLWEEEDNLIVFVTHDITEALLLADRVIVLSPRPARIVKDLVVPFARPRHPDVVRQEAFVTLSQALLELLKQTPNGGQVRVSI
ncbi:MAG: ABC transporter ATP-binding protein [Armatimonadetes bacterium]|nr:ABC transporter ATP-binding protein [Armatimonadota bacterium]